MAQARQGGSAPGTGPAGGGVGLKKLQEQASLQGMPAPGAGTPGGQMAMGAPGQGAGGGKGKQISQLPRPGRPGRPAVGWGVPQGGEASTAGVGQVMPADWQQKKKAADAAMASMGGYKNVPPPNWGANAGLGDVQSNPQITSMLQSMAAQKPPMTQTPGAMPPGAPQLGAGGGKGATNAQQALLQKQIAGLPGGPGTMS